MGSLRLVLPAIALGGAAFLIAPHQSAGAFTVLGGSLSAEGQRDFRVHNNFVDPESNDNVTPHPNWPGYVGAELAFWKAIAEWGSEPFGDGSGDPLGGNVLGSGGANFDAFWAGTATGAGSLNDHIVEALPLVGDCSGGVIAYVESTLGGSWTMKFCDGSFTFWDGPGDNARGFDIQGVAVHEFGHSLGLGHSTDVNASMFGSTTPSASSNFRSIEADDIAGVQFIYGVKSSTKPRIDAVSLAGGQVTITGVNFSTSGGEVWFTPAGPTTPSADPRVRLTNVMSSAGGTQIDIAFPAGASSGVVQVKQSTFGHATLSNAFPLDDGTGFADPDPRFNATPMEGDPPLNVVFKDLSVGSGISSWSWDFGDGATSTLQSPTHVYTTPGTFDVTLGVTGSNGSSSVTKPAFICIEDPFPKFSASPASGSAPLAVTFTDLSLGTSLSSWLWDFGDGTASTEQNPVHVYTQTGTFDVELTVTGFAGSNELLEPDLIVVTNGTQASCTGNNGSGTNPDVFTCQVPPTIGGIWQAQVDGSGLGASGISIILGYEGALTGLPTSFGELLIDPTSTFALASTSFFLGGIALHSEAVPNNLELIGFTFSAQGFINGIRTLTNRQDLVLGN